MTTVSLSLGKKGEDTSSTRTYIYVVLSFQTHFAGQFPAQRARALSSWQRQPLIFLAAQEVTLGPGGEHWFLTFRL